MMLLKLTKNGVMIECKARGINSITALKHRLSHASTIHYITCLHAMAFFLIITFVRHSDGFSGSALHAAAVIKSINSQQLGYPRLKSSEFVAG